MRSERLQGTLAVRCPLPVRMPPLGSPHFHSVLGDYECPVRRRRTKRPTPAQLAPLATRQARPPRCCPQPLIERLLAAAMERGGEFAEVYVERAVTTAVVLEEQRIKSAQTGLVAGRGRAGHLRGEGGLRLLGRPGRRGAAAGPRAPRR